MKESQRNEQTGGRGLPASAGSVLFRKLKQFIQEPEDFLSRLGIRISRRLQGILRSGLKQPGAKIRFGKVAVLLPCLLQFLAVSAAEPEAELMVRSRQVLECVCPHCGGVLGQLNALTNGSDDGGKLLLGARQLAAAIEVPADQTGDASSNDSGDDLSPKVDGRSSPPLWAEIILRSHIGLLIGGALGAWLFFKVMLPILEQYQEYGWRLRPNRGIRIK